jgi:hypothetical protein
MSLPLRRGCSLFSAQAPTLAGRLEKPVRGQARFLPSFAANTRRFFRKF